MKKRQVLHAFERCVFNLVFNNRDDHAKNFSFLLASDGHWQFSPAYDLTFNEGPRGEHQMDICGEARAPARRHLLRLAGMAGISARSAGQAIERIATVAGGLRSFAQALPILPETLDLIQAKVEANRARML